MTRRDLDFAAQLAELERELSPQRMVRLSPGQVAYLEEKYGPESRRMLRQERHDRDGCETSPCPVCENEDRPEDQPCATA